jgi:hypothetical protein
VTVALAIFLLASLARLLLNNVQEFSPSDENVMLRYAAQTTARDYSYRLACERWLETPRAWLFPGIIRYGNIFLIGGLCRLFRVVSFRIPSTVSTVSGQASGITQAARQVEAREG